jgi:hypothetical protein
MAKTLKDILEVAKPVSASDKEFVTKHTIKKTPDADKNGDDVFNATKIKTYKRAPTHGYDAGADEKAYEVKCSNTAAGVACPVHGASKCPGYMSEGKKSLSDILEKHLTSNEKSKREEIAMAIKRENPSMPMGKKMAIATAQAKKVAEEVDLDENAFNQLGQKKPVGDILPAPAKGSVPIHGKKFKEGDIVVPHAGPHAGVKHKVVVARAGSVNMIPLGISAKEDKYNSSTVRAKHEHLSPYIAEETDLDEAAMKYAQVDPNKVKKVIDAHRKENPGEVARHMGNGKIAYTGPKMNTNLGESYEELDEGVAKDMHDTHHKRAMAALNDIGKHLMKQKAMCDKSDNKWAHQDNAWAMKDISRQLEDMAQGAAQRTENMTPVPTPKDTVRGY